MGERTGRPRGRPKGSKNKDQGAIQEMRGGLKRFLAARVASGKPASTMWAELYKSDIKAFFDMAIKVHPKEMLIEQNVNHTAQLDTSQIPPDLMREAIAARRAESEPDSGDQPVH